ncbi:hypothetical protein M514_12714 [Trichuris suis]|uniref:Uncharacterized protein n=1 Tax=Trichuris suis TaxID=68888 RepID=A0A085N476_9BILA|nr:hypothetical protein M513_12714 [Trichuris suis]KFD64272.1 hypothetical protein M514_12714 [Trichuris suis]
MPSYIRHIVPISGVSEFTWARPYNGFASVGPHAADSLAYVIALTKARPRVGHTPASVQGDLHAGRPRSLLCGDFHPPAGAATLSPDLNDHSSRGRVVCECVQTA